MMFVGMFLALPIHFLLHYLERRKGEKQFYPEGTGTGNEYVRLDDGGLHREPGDEWSRSNQNNETISMEAENPGANGNGNGGKISLHTAGVLAIPSVFDLVATALANIGLVMINVSVYQLMKCTVIIFVAIFKSRLLGVKLENNMWIGVAVNMLAVCIVASTSFFPSAGAEVDDDVDSKSGSAGMGILFVVLSCLVQSGQYVYEEKVMDEGALSIEPLVVVGMEGFWGLLFSVFLVLPAAGYIPGKDCPHSSNHSCVYEDTLDTFDMMDGQYTIIILTVAYVVIITGYNVAAVYVTYLLDSVWHAILDNFRPISVWLVQLILFQVLDGKFGEKWATSSWLQLAGLIVLLIGTAIYNGNIKVPCGMYPETRKVRDFDSVSLSTSPFFVVLEVDVRTYKQLTA
eukprot:CAMPEP_0204836982 /NCGR_PEP_ID=MMETSP1346-20131115/26788_1 /ASSEMBLY_ACC=CAM_ASM_000771 /TAXON_ID=215587 /ORGANISM="Aplanochytrium stocchinoi, Strain GSBS06" /LENGTH=400 /DNA_ID=CAMNT_0051972157 /DNA_START=181 /DNA_END=1384 /DNA_ORIENTATION=-